MNTSTELGAVSFSECIDEEQRDFCFSLRHTTYCEILKFEEENDDKMERDEFDDDARHFTIQLDNIDIGCFRVVSGGTSHLQTYISLNSLFEISRFIILPQYRHPAILFSIVKELAKTIEHYGLMPTYMIAEKKFAKFISLSGVQIRKSSPYFNLNGVRAAYLFNRES